MFELLAVEDIINIIYCLWYRLIAQQGYIFESHDGGSPAVKSQKLAPRGKYTYNV